MNIAHATAIADKVNDQYLKSVYDLISKSAIPHTIAGDSEPYMQLPSGVCEQISQLGYSRVQANYIERFGQIQTPAEVQKEMFVKMAGDALINRKSGIGTMLDPSVYTHSQIPVMLGPWEGSSVYAPGGLPATIIDKKARGMVMHGASFKSENKEVWTNDKIEQMEAAAEITGFNDVVSDASADAYIYGS